MLQLATSIIYMSYMLKRISGTSVKRCPAKRTLITGNGTKKGFASMSAKKRDMIASMGGRKVQALGKAHRFTSEEAKRAGRLKSAKRASLLLKLLQDTLNQDPAKPVNLAALGKELGISRQYAHFAHQRPFLRTAELAIKPDSANS
jgi:hypothetical protein